MTCLDVCGKKRPREGIGTLSEKTLHATVKKFIEPNGEFHEVNVEGHIADVKNANGIFEVQTRSFNKLRAKLECFLQKETVTVVYPLPAEKRLLWLDGATGEISAPHKSPKRGRSYDAIPELYKLGDLITHEKLRILLLFIDIDEYRCLRENSKPGKRYSTRFDRIPKRLSDSFFLADNNDYADRFLPRELPFCFTSKDLARTARIPLPLAQTTLTVLTKRGVILCVGKSGRLHLYKKSESDNKT